MEVVIDYEYLTGTHGEEIIKELSVASKDVRETFRFLPPTAWTHIAAIKTGSAGTTEVLVTDHYSKPWQKPPPTLPIYTLKSLTNATFSLSCWGAPFKI
jgi:hypothetical protein